MRNFLIVLFLLFVLSSFADTLWTPIEISMRDGNVLAADLYSIDTMTQKPVILIQTPYNKEPYRYYSFFMDVTDTTGFWNLQEYNFVILDWRGYYASASAAVAGYDRGDDGYDAVEWIAERAWCNGNVGTYGGSALGAIQFKTIQKHPPHLVCSAPWIKDYIMRYEDYFVGGVLKDAQSDFHDSHGFFPRELLLEHPYCCDLFWNYIETSSDNMELLNVPMFILTGWFDHSPDFILEDFYEMVARSDISVRDQHKIMVGPWTHSKVGAEEVGELSFPEAAGAEDEMVKLFFDYYLRGADNGYEDLPQGQFFIMQKDEWIETDDWYSISDSQVILYLNADGNMIYEPSSLETSFTEYEYNPSDPTPTYGGDRFDTGTTLKAGPVDQRDSVEARDDVIVFTSPELTSEITVTGMVTAILYVSTDRLDTDFNVRITDVFPDGRSMILDEGIRRLRFRDSFAEGELAVPGEIYELEIPIRSLGQSFLVGHKIRVAITSSSFNKYDRNLNNGGAMYTEGDTLIATNKVYHDSEHHSRVILETRTSLAVTEQEGVTAPENIRLYPNPFIDEINVIFGNITDIKVSDVSLTDLYGRNVSNINVEKFGNNSFHIEVGELEAGIYFVNITNGNTQNGYRILHLN